ncbi:uncharacterized protein LOC124973229 isoform X2 [Sciurus carolinensis]|uniref:uncharacterized protein LOC124973229 isoform X2 n=2 Tax=Sciurus carolinensis TaxID=30640 RepID=UPI001FB3BB9E|nr:uncharacterized protein LOC124973229 isoform X2 [Sciurus carolinensis]
MISFQFISFQSFPLTEASRSRNPQSRMVISRGAGKDRGGRKEERPPLLHAPTNPPASHLPGPSSSSSSSPPLPPSRPGPQVPPTKQRQRQRHRHRPPRPPRENGILPPPTQVSRELTLAAGTHKGLARANSNWFPSQALLHLLPKLNPLDIRRGAECTCGALVSSLVQQRGTAPTAASQEHVKVTQAGKREA